jgi:hypothetical protein
MLYINTVIALFFFNAKNVIIRGCKWNEAVTENVTVFYYRYIHYQVTEVLVLTSLPWK